MKKTTEENQRENDVEKENERKGTVEEFCCLLQTSRAQTTTTARTHVTLSGSQVDIRVHHTAVSKITGLDRKIHVNKRQIFHTSVGQGKGKFTLEETTKTQRNCRGIVVAFNLGGRRGWVVHVTNQGWAKAYM